MTTRRLLAHAALLWVGLLVLMPVVGVHRAPFTSDEGAMTMQVDTLIDTGGSWRATYPLADLDPTGEFVALPYARYANETIVPYTSRPVYVYLNLFGARLGGIWAITAIGTLTTALAALAGGLAAREVRPSSSVPALWLIGVGSPLLFHGYILQGHSIGALSVAVALLLAMRAGRQPRHLEVLIPIALALVLAMGAVVRREVVFAALGIAVWGGFQALARRSRFDAVLGAAAIAGAGAGVVLDRLLGGYIFGSSLAPNVPVMNPTIYGLIEGRLYTAYHSTLLSTFDELGAIDTVALMGVLLALVGIVVLRRRREVPLLVAGLALLGLTALVRAAVHASPPLVPGLIMASPVLVLGVALIPVDALRRREGALAGIVAVIAVTGSLATQYQGSWEWGARFLAIAVPPIAILSAIGWGTTPERLHRTGSSLVSATAIATVVAFGLLTVVAQREGRLAVEDLRSTVTSSATHDTIIVTTEAWMPRYDTSQLDDVGYRWARVGEEDLPNLLAHLDERGVAHVVIAGLSVRDIPELAASAGWTVTETEALPTLRFPLALWRIEQ